ncbi:T9SS type A sorting domain-containing protein [Hymenobacter sp. BT664]|uniref:T9SS type A sorting domain-containing protein n=1 Tax=Hymenobacter montanus TaxID=2771359 RepID=A0A927BAY1_9BACT|nr:T9SS type A sorting domain-containing protein [Hymenobacter montanus]MBD2766834.1 T9SS type A sorting domain-containing protein [Hymenobacter montanus]
MTTQFYTRTASRSGQWRRLATLAVGLLLAPGAWAQIQVPAGNPNVDTGRKPLGTDSGYERSALIYTAAEIATSGTLTQLAFYLNAVGGAGAAPTKVYLKTVSNTSFAAPTTVAAEEAGATLVYDATIPAASFTANTWITLPLTTPFTYNGTSNLEVIVETNATSQGNEGFASKAFRYSLTGVSRNPAQFWDSDFTAPAGVGTLSLIRPNIRLTGLAPLACPPVTSLSVSNVTATSAQVSFTPGAGNTSYAVTYTPVGGAPITVPATTSPVNLTGLTEATAYTVAIAGNCTGGTTAPLAPTYFITPPANDDCASAAVLATTATCTPTTASNFGATASTGVPPLRLYTMGGCFEAGDLVSNDIWYRVVVPPSGGFTVTTSAVTGSPVYNVDLALYTGTCGALTEVACDDNTGDGQFASAQVNDLPPGSTVYVRAWSFGVTPTGQFGICAVPNLMPPSNNECATATVLTPAATCTPTITTNLGATPSTGVPPPTSSDTGCFAVNTPINNDVWYRIVVPASGGFTVTTSPVPGSDVEDTALIVYTGTCGALTEIACSDDTDEDSFSSTRVVGLTPGSTVYVRVWSYRTTPTGQFGICAVPVPANDAAVQTIYSMGKLPTGVPQAVRAVVTNAGGLPITSLSVTLNVTGATTFTNTQTVTTPLAPGASATVFFPPYTPNTVGTNTLTVTLSADDVPTNNSRVYTQLVTANTFSYANNTAPDPGDNVGIGPFGTAAFVARYTTPVARSLTGITAALADNNTVGRTLYGVVVNSGGAVLARTPNYVVTAADINRRKTFPLATPFPLAAGDFYVGLVQTPSASGQYSPLATLPENPTRPGTFFRIVPFSASTGGVLEDLAPNNFGVLVLEAETNIILASNSPALSKAVSLFPNPSSGQVTLEIREAKAAGALQVQVTNLLGQVVHTATVRDNAQNPLDLSALAAGMYLVRVQAGSAYTLRQLVLTK